MVGLTTRDRRVSNLFDCGERGALEYAEAATVSDCDVDDGLFAYMRHDLNDDVMIKLTGILAFQHLSRKFGSALAIPRRESAALQISRATGSKRGSDRAARHINPSSSSFGHAVAFVRCRGDGTMRIRQLTMKILLGLVLAGAVASVGVVTPRTIRITGPTGAPVDAWAVYHYRGYRFGFVESLSYTRAGTIARSDADGLLRLPGKIYLRFPLDGWLQPQVELLYAPALHSAIRYPLAADPVQRIFERGTDGRTLRVADQTGDPELWAHSLEQLFTFVRYDLMNAAQRDISVNPQDINALTDEMIADYRAFIAYHADTPRAMPTIGMDRLRYAPDAERDATLDHIREDLAREPFWGPYMERTWVPRITELERATGK